jgi:hypothetical protein
MTVVRFRTLAIDVKIVAPTEGAAEDFERELKYKLRRAAHNGAMARRHNVEVYPPQFSYRHSQRQPTDSDFSVYVQAVPMGRR